MQIYEFCFVSCKQLCYCSLFRFGNIRFVFELSNKKAASLADAKSYFPTQKCLKIFPRTSSVSIVPPTISPK